MQSARHEFEQVALPWLDQLHTAALRLTRDPVDADDLVQDTVVTAYRFWSSFKQGTNVRAWLLTILRNIFITRYQKQNRARDLDHEVSRHMKSVGENVALGSTAPDEGGVEERLEEKIERMRVLSALDSG